MSGGSCHESPPRPSPSRYAPSTPLPLMRTIPRQQHYRLTPANGSASYLSAGLPIYQWERELPQRSLRPSSSFSSVPPSGATQPKPGAGTARAALVAVGCSPAYFCVPLLGFSGSFPPPIAASRVARLPRPLWWPGSYSPHPAAARLLTVLVARLYPGAAAGFPALAAFSPSLSIKKGSVYTIFAYRVDAYRLRFS